jgi:hypothetical protein
MNIAVGIPVFNRTDKAGESSRRYPLAGYRLGVLGGHVNRCQRARNSSWTGGTGGSPFGGITGIVTEEDDDSAIGRLRAEVDMRLRNSTRQPGISQFVRGRSAFAFDFHAAAAAGAPIVLSLILASQGAATTVYRGVSEGGVEGKLSQRCRAGRRNAGQLNDRYTGSQGRNGRRMRLWRNIGRSGYCNSTPMPQEVAR